MPHFAHPNTQQLLKTPVKSSLFSPNSCTTQIKVVPLHRQSSPSLLTMLKSCEAFFVYGTSHSIHKTVLFISRTCHLAEILVFSNDSYFFVNIENMGCLWRLKQRVHIGRQAIITDIIQIILGFLLVFYIQAS